MDNLPKLTREEVMQFLHMTVTNYVGQRSITPTQVIDYIADLESKLVKMATVVAEKL